MERVESRIHEVLSWSGHVWSVEYDDGRQMGGGKSDALAGHHGQCPEMLTQLAVSWWSQVRNIQRKWCHLMIMRGGRAETTFEDMIGS